MNILARGHPNAHDSFFFFLLSVVYICGQTKHCCNARDFSSIVIAGNVLIRRLSGSRFTTAAEQSALRFFFLWTVTFLALQCWLLSKWQLIRNVCTSPWHKLNSLDLCAQHQVNNAAPKHKNVCWVPLALLFLCVYFFPNRAPWICLSVCSIQVTKRLYVWFAYLSLRVMGCGF